MKKRYPGFTIVELMVVMVVISILATLVSLNVVSAKMKSRDTKRISELVTLGDAIDLYYLENKSYPICTDADCLTGVLGEFGGHYITEANMPADFKQYLPVLPRDPKTGSGYAYARWINPSGKPGYGLLNQFEVDGRGCDKNNNFDAGAGLDLPCDCKSGVNMNPGWWTPAIDCVK